MNPEITLVTKQQTDSPLTPPEKCTPLVGHVSTPTVGKEAPAKPEVKSCTPLVG